MVIKVLVEGTVYNYVIDPLNTDFRNYEPIDGVNVYKKLMIEKIDGVRMVLSPPLSSGKEHYFEYLCWTNYKDLDDLDQRVINNNYSDADFEDSFKTYFKSKILCTNCGMDYKGFSVDISMPYVINKDLRREKLIKISNNNLSLSCPSCKAPFRIIVLKVITVGHGG